MQAFEAFSGGIVWGVGLAMLLGPVFFALIRTALDKGFRAGAFLALGVALSDSVVLLMVYFGISQIAEEAWFQTRMALVGGSIMLGFGLLTLLKSETEKATVQDTGDYAIAAAPTQNMRYFAEGFLLNFLNPSVYLFWIGIVAKGVEAYEPQYVSFFFYGIIMTVLCTDLCKAYFAQRIAGYLHTNTLAKIDKIAGVGITIFGLQLLLSTFN